MSNPDIAYYSMILLKVMIFLLIYWLEIKAPIGVGGGWRLGILILGVKFN